MAEFLGEFLAFFSCRIHGLNYLSDFTRDPAISVDCFILDIHVEMYSFARYYCIRRVVVSDVIALNKSAYLLTSVTRYGHSFNCCRLYTGVCRQHVGR